MKMHEHLGRDFEVVERAAVGQPVADQAVDDRRAAVGAVGRRRSTIGIR